jgi:hypothetical protein
MKTRIDRMEKYFTDPDQLPKVFRLVTDMAELLNGSFNGVSGVGLENMLSNLKTELRSEINHGSS